MNHLCLYQECSTWLNIAAAQEESGCSSEDVDGSYSKASHCAQTSGQARLQVCWKKHWNLWQPICIVKDFYFEHPAKFWGWTFALNRNVCWGSGWRFRDDAARQRPMTLRRGCGSCVPLRAGIQKGAMVKRTKRRRWTTVNLSMTATSSSQTLVNGVNLSEWELEFCLSANCRWINSLLVCLMWFFCMFSRWWVGGLWQDGVREEEDRKGEIVVPLHKQLYHLCFWRLHQFLLWLFRSGTRGMRKARRLCTERA